MGPETETETCPQVEHAAGETRTLAITAGDPAGIGPEVVESWWRSIAGDEIPKRHLVFLGPPDWLDRLHRIRPIEGVPIGPAGILPGRPDRVSAESALESLETAAEGCLRHRYAGVVTGPVSKSRLSEIGFTYPGQTEFFAARWGGAPTMAFAGGQMRVALATWHIPLAKVPEALTRETMVRTIRHAVLLARAIADAQSPRIACCGLNPHAGEGGILGHEERTYLDPLLDELRPEFPGLSECLSADTVFRRQIDGEFDVVIALYHDQGLAPLKTFEFEKSVNITLGLPYVRTSADHGTAFGLAGRGEASHTSFANAVFLARKLLRFHETFS